MQIIKSHKYWRLFEILPATLAWTALILPIILSIFKPAWVALFVMLYALLWLFRSIKLSAYLVIAYLKTARAKQINWTERLKFIENPNLLAEKIKITNSKKEKKELIELQQKLQKVKELNQKKTPQQIYHAIMLLTYKEDIDLLRFSINSYVNSEFPKNKIILILAGEERDRENFLKIANTLKQEYLHQFLEILIMVHPKNIPGEISGKAANAGYASREFKKWLDEKNIAYDDVMLSNFDADTVTSKQYFAELTHHYLTTINRVKHSYQPLHLYHNNIWEVPVIIRLVALSASFWKLAETINPKKFRSFSSRSDSFAFVHDVGYWDPAIIPEDSRQFWTAYTKYDGDHRLIPIYSPLSMDAVSSETFLKTCKNQYLQLRRWAWGACDVPFVVLNLSKNKKIPFKTKAYKIFALFESHFFWATAPMIIAFTGWYPGLMNPDFNKTTLAYTLPYLTSNILSLAMTGIITCIGVSFLLLPLDKARANPTKMISLILQWMLVPVASIFLSAIPAMEAQTRLMLNKRLDYQVTEKHRKTKTA